MGAFGLLALIAGTFLPWLHSGRATRNSYQAGGAVRRLIDPTGLIDDALALWPLLGLACATVVALYLLGLRTLATVLAGIAALGAGAAAIGALATTATSYAQVAIAGPIMTLFGATLVALAVLLSALARTAPPRCTAAPRSTDE